MEVASAIETYAQVAAFESFDRGFPMSYDQLALMRRLFKAALQWQLERVAMMLEDMVVLDNPEAGYELLSVADTLRSQMTDCNTDSCITLIAKIDRSYTYISSAGDWEMVGADTDGMIGKTIGHSRVLPDASIKILRRMVDQALAGHSAQSLIPLIDRCHGYAWRITTVPCDRDTVLLSVTLRKSNIVRLGAIQQSDSSDAV